VNLVRRVLTKMAPAARFVLEHRVRLSAGLVVVACAVFIGVAPFTYRAIWIVCVAPVLVGALITVLSFKRLSSWINELSETFSTGAEKARAGSSDTDKYIRRPFHVTGSAVWSGSAFVRQAHVMAGLRATATIYVSMVVLALVGALAAAWLFAVAFMLTVKAILWIASDDESREKRKQEADAMTEAAVSHPVPGRFYRGPGWPCEELAGRVDSEGNIYRGSSWLSEERIGRIGSDGTIYRGTSLLDEAVAGRIDSNGIIHKGSDWFTQERVGRVRDDGTVLRGTSWLDEERVGRIKDD